MPGQFWVAHVGGPPNAGPGTAYASSTTITDVSPAPQIVVPANFLNYVGASVRLTSFGTFSNTGTPTLILGFYLGGVAGVALGATGATTTTTGATNWPWRLEMTATVRTIGASATIITQGLLFLATSLTAGSTIPIPATALATVTRDLTASQAVTTGATWGTSSASNTLTCHQMLVESVA